MMSFSNSSAISSSLTIPLRRRIRRIDSSTSCVDGAICKARFVARARLDEGGGDTGSRGLDGSRSAGCAAGGTISLNRSKSAVLRQ
jgi:hypothetical protein